MLHAYAFKNQGHKLKTLNSHDLSHVGESLVFTYNPLAKTRLVWHPKMNFIRAWTTEHFPVSSAFIPYNRGKSLKLPVAKLSKESVITHDVRLAFINPTYNSLAIKLVLSGVSK